MLNIKLGQSVVSGWILCFDFKCVLRAVVDVEMQYLKKKIKRKFKNFVQFDKILIGILTSDISSGASTRDNNNDFDRI